MFISRKQARMINHVLRIVAVHGMAQVRDLYCEVGEANDFERIHFVIKMTVDDLKLLRLEEADLVARITSKGLIVSHIGIRTYLLLILLAKIVVVAASICTVLSFVFWLCLNC